jgi:hypothetical protein
VLSSRSEALLFSFWCPNFLSHGSPPRGSCLVLVFVLSDSIPRSRWKQPDFRCWRWSARSRIPFGFATRACRILFTALKIFPGSGFQPLPPSTRLPRFPPFQADRPAQASILAAQAPGQRTPLTERTSSQRQDLGLLVFFFSLCRVHRQASALCPICFSLDFCCRSIRSSIQLPPSPAPQFGFLHEERTRVSFC